MCVTGEQNFNDAANYNPLNKGKVSFLSLARVKLCATLDIGKAAAVCFKNQEQWDGRTLDIASWQGDVHEVAAALQKVSGTPTRGALAMPLFFRWAFLNDLHHMCKYFEHQEGFKADIDAFRTLVPDAMTAGK